MSVLNRIKSLRDALFGSLTPHGGANRVSDVTQEPAENLGDSGQLEPSHSRDFNIPEGCQLEVYSEPPVIHAVNRTRGGCLIASMGILTDQGPSEMDTLMAKVDAFILDKLPTTLLITEATRLSAVFSSSVATAQVALVVWILEPRAFFLPHGERLLVKLISKWIEIKIAADVTSIIFLKSVDAPVVTAVATALRHAGLSCRTPDEDGAYVFCAEHVDGKVVSSLGGRVCVAENPPSPWFRSRIEDRLDAERRGDQQRVADIECELWGHLKQVLRLECDVVPNLDLAIGFRRLLRLAHEAAPDAYRNLLEHLLRLETPLIFICNPTSVDSRTMQVVSFPDNRTGVELLPDNHAAQIAMKDFKLDPKATRLVSLMPPHRNIFKWLAESMLGVSVWVDDPEHGAHSSSGFGVFVSAEHLGQLATGALPDG